MREIQNTLSVETIENMFLTEMHYQEIAITPDPRLRYDIVHQAVESIIKEQGANLKTDPEFCLEIIRAYIWDIDANYPQYFMTGEEY